MKFKVKELEQFECRFYSVGAGYTASTGAKRIPILGRGSRADKQTEEAVVAYCSDRHQAEAVVKGLW